MKTLAIVVLAAAIYVSAFVYVLPNFSFVDDSPPASGLIPPNNVPRTEVTEGRTHRYGAGCSCPCTEPCGYCECRDGVCTRLYDVKEQDIQAEITADELGYISMTISDEGCKPGRYDSKVTLRCNGEDYYDEAYVEAIIEPYETLHMQLERPWISRIETRLECSVVFDTEHPVSWTTTLILKGISRISGCYERPIQPTTGAIIEEVLPDGTSCTATVYSWKSGAGEPTIDHGAPGLCGNGICGPNIPFWWIRERNWFIRWLPWHT